MSLPTLQRHYLRLVRLWPSGNFRQITFQKAFRERLETRFLKPAAAPQKQVSSNEALVTPTELKVDETREREELNALYSLLENRYMKQYPCSDKMFRPTFQPDYYELLAEELEAAPKRSWLQNKWLRFSQIVRFS